MNTDWHGFPPNPYNPHALIIEKVEIGENCWIGPFTVLDGSGGLRIGSNTEISAGAQIYTHSSVKRAVSGGSVEIERAPTVIGKHVHIGANAVILMGSQIGDYCTIGAGAVVTQFSIIASGSTVVGVPARVIKHGED
jgi:acetyltransferase-like isoleucine patch superfamily enzyme